MKTYLVSCLLLILSTTLVAQIKQKQSSITTDSILLEGVVIISPTPVMSRQIENFYKSNTLSTIDNVIEKLDGVSLIRRGSYAMEPTLNGFSGGQINITIDGMKMFGACTDRMDPITSYIEPSNLKSVTVLQGSGGSHSGSNVGGSMDMSLQEPHVTVDQPFNSSLSLGYETASNGKTALFSTGYLRNRLQWGLNTSYRKHDSYTDGTGEVVDFTQYEKTNLHSVLKYYLPDSSQNIKADVLFDLARNVGYAALPMDVSKARAILGAIEFRSIRKTNLTAKIYFNSILHIMDDSKRDSVFYVTNKTSGQKEMVYMHMDMPGSSSTLGAYFQAVFGSNPKNKFTIQADNYTNHSLAEMTMYMQYPETPPENPMYLQTWPDIIRNVTGIYVQNRWFASKNIYLTISGRADLNISAPQSELAGAQFSVFQYDLKQKYQCVTKSANLALQYSLSAPLSLKLEAGYSERIPTIGEQFGFYLYNAYDGYDYIGYPEIKTEKSDFARVVIQFTKPGFKVNFSQSFNMVHDYIMGITDSTIPPMNFYTNGTRVYTNVPNAKMYNVNIQMQCLPLPELSLFLLTKYTWGKLYSGDPLPLIAPLNNVLAISYQKSGWNFKLENETALAQNRINSDFGETKSETYTVFNIKTSRHFMFLKPVMLDCSLGVTNLFNAIYYEHLDWGQINRPGRSIDLLIKFSF